MFRIIAKEQRREKNSGNIDSSLPKANPFKCITSIFNQYKQGSRKKESSSRNENRFTSSTNLKQDIAYHGNGGGKPGQQLERIFKVLNSPAKKEVRCLSDYEILNTLGRGMSGKVKCAYSPRTDEYVAIKVVDNRSSKDSAKMIHTEIGVLQSIAHPNLLKLISVHRVPYVGKSGRARELTCLVLEYAKGGSLLDLMVGKGPLSEIITRTYFHQLVTALAFCHSKGVYHRDIKPENLLLSEDFQLKICDFGLSSLSCDRTELLKTECGTRAYMAPEVLKGKPYNGEKSDCWSAGIFLFLMLSGNPPFHIALKSDWWYAQLEQGNDERFWKAHRQYFAGFTRMNEAILTRMLRPDPSKRPTMSELLDDVWLRERKLNALELKEAVSRIKAEVVVNRNTGKTRATKKDVLKHGTLKNRESLRFKDEATAASQEASLTLNTSQRDFDVPLPLTNGDTPLSENEEL